MAIKQIDTTLDSLIEKIGNLKISQTVTDQSLQEIEDELVNFGEKI
ncbi:MAG: hypothetical protein K8R39_03085 [Arcobacteraceae bacterium]|nr:hypothetical protein [Arcobacteraceae bacterium]